MIDITKAKYGSAPFRWWIIDNSIMKERAELFQIYLNDIKDFSKFYSYENAFEGKLATDKWELFAPTIQYFFLESLGGKFIGMLEQLTGINGLIGDHTLRGGGIHIHTYGGKLSIHRDFTKHEKLGLIRRLNVLLYLNKDYTHDKGGALELWEKDMSKAVFSIAPIMNRMVIFETPDAPHGLGTPWNCKETNRMSLALYYYTAPTLEDLQKEHLSTQFLKKPGEVTDETTEILRRKRNLGRLGSNL